MCVEVLEDLPSSLRYSLQCGNYYCGLDAFCIHSLYKQKKPADARVTCDSAAI